MMKRKFLAILFIFTTCVFSTFSVEKVKIGDLYYNLNPDDRTAEVTSQNSSYPYWTTDITTANIPTSIEYHSTTYRVTNIEEHAFDGCESLTSITIPNSITDIEGNFFYCSNLHTINVEYDNLNYTSIDGVLYDKSKTKLIRCPRGRQGTYSIPRGVRIIESHAFSRCESLSSVTIPNSVTSINGTTPFYGCRNLHTISVANDNLSYTSIDGVLFNKGKTKLLRCPGGKQGSYSVPRGVTCIEYQAFIGCDSLISIEIPNSVTNIGAWAFSDCESLTSITIPNSVTSIGESAFRGCSGLTSVTIPGSITSIGDNAFSGCISLTTITIPNSVTQIGDWAFSGCKSLISVSIPNSVTSIGAGAFSRCESLTSVTIPNSVTSINDGTTPFYGCRNLHTINVANDNPNYSSIDGVLFNKSKTKLLRCPIGKQGTYSIPRGVISIEPCAFEDCEGLISVSIPNSVTCIGKSAFSSCKGLTSVTIPNSVTRIGNSAFSNCINLISPVYNTHCFIRLPESYCGTYTIPNGIRTISGSAFARCDSLISIEIPSSVTNIGDYAFSSCHGLTSVKIPNSVTSIGEWAFQGCISLRSVTIPNSVTSIGECAFLNCNNILSPTYNSHVFAYMPRSYNGAYTIPNGIESIADGAFYGCKSLTSVLIPRSVTKIAKDAFPFCVNLYAINVVYDNPNYTSINGVLFDKSKTKLVRCPPGIQGRYLIPYGIISIGCYAFHLCKGLTSVRIPNSVTKIETWAFAHCSGLTSIEIPFNVTNIEKEAFWGDDIKEFYYPKGLDLSQAGICSTKIVAYSPTNFSTSTTTASSRSTFDTNSATTSRTAATQPSTPTTKPVSTAPTTPTSRPICTILSPKDKYTYYSNSTINIRYKVENLSEGQTIEYYVDDPTKSVPIQGTKGIRVEQGTELKIDIPQSGTHVVGIRVMDAYGMRSEDTRTFIYRSVHKPTLHVFAVGVNKYKYKGEGFNDLKYAVDDAKDFSKTIINLADRDTYKQVDTTLLLDGAANRANLEDQLIELMDRVQANDVVMLFFSGHGVNINGDSYFLTSDAKDPLRGLSFHFINQRIKDMKSKGGHILIFMDACHSGGMGNVKGSSSKSITLAEPGAIGYYSCADNQTSIEKEELKNGVFTYALIEGVRGNKYGQITMWGLYNSILEIVKKENEKQYPRLLHDKEIDNDYVIFYKKK